MISLTFFIYNYMDKNDRRNNLVFYVVLSMYALCIFVMDKLTKFSFAFTCEYIWNLMQLNYFINLLSSMENEDEVVEFKYFKNIN